MVTVQIDNKSAQAKKLIEMLKTFDFVQIVSKNGTSSNKGEKSPYNPEFVKMIKDAENGKSKKIDTKNLWKSIQ